MTRRAGGRLRADAGHSCLDVAGKRGGIGRIDERDVDPLHVFAARGHGGLARQVQEVRKVKLHLPNHGAEPGGIRCRLVDARHAEPLRGRAVGLRAEPHDVAHPDVLAFGELPRNQD